ncbi:anthranilate synthase component II [Croceimicrobium sp.]|uniref:anthranilate synthase component II n=1 Tax=Croceimicrobium sp. TaxID=2828340 RepID=UPI003BAA7499
MKLLLIDNYDSFTYNLEHYFSALGADVVVKRNREFSLEEVENYDAVVLSPGPGLPQEAGNCMELIDRYHRTKPILGICLGAQALAEYFGAELYNQQEVAHGVSRIVHREANTWLLKGLEESFSVGLYHSWAIRPQADFLNRFKVVAQRANSIVMAFEDEANPIAGIQFHPESIMTEGGREMLMNWMNKIEL